MDRAHYLSDLPLHKTVSTSDTVCSELKAREFYSKAGQASQPLSRLKEHPEGHDLLSTNKMFEIT